MQKMGLEPTRYCYHRHLKPARLPIPPLLLGTIDTIHDNAFFVKYFFKIFFISGNSSDKVLHFGWPDAGRDGLPGFLAALIRRPRSQNVTPDALPQNKRQNRMPL